MVFECPSCNKNYKEDLFNRHKVFCDFYIKQKGKG